MTLLITLGNLFEAKVMSARLGADGIYSELRGTTGGTYPMGRQVELWVENGAYAEATELLFADELATLWDGEHRDGEYNNRCQRSRKRSFSHHLPGKHFFGNQFPNSGFAPDKVPSTSASPILLRVLTLLLVLVVVLAAAHQFFGLFNV